MSSTTKKSIQNKLEIFFNDYPNIKFKPNELILRPSQPINSIYYIKNGYTRWYCISKDGEELTMHIAKPGSFFPIMIVLANTQNKYYWEATVPTEVYKAPAEDVIAMLKSEPEILFDLNRRFAKGLCGMLARIEEVTFSSSYTKIMSVLSYFGNKYGKNKLKQTLIQFRLTHSDIAAWTGLSRETVSRRLEKMEKIGIISHDKRYIVIHKDRVKLLSSLI